MTVPLLSPWHEIVILSQGEIQEPREEVRSAILEQSPLTGDRTNAPLGFLDRRTCITTLILNYDQP
jgi:hypothetical protein